MRFFIDHKKFLRGLVPMPVMELPEDWWPDKALGPKQRKLKGQAAKARNRARRYEVEV